MNKQTHKPHFLIVSPPQFWGGPVVLHLLCRMLADYGYDAKVFRLRTDLICPSSRREFLQVYLPFMNKKAEQNLDSQEGAVKGCELTNWPYVDEDTIVVYPEVVIGNPLAAKHVVRWFLNKPRYPRIYIGEPPYNSDDLFICYREIFNDDTLNPTCRQVQLLHYNHELYKRTNYGRREGNCFIIRKGHIRADLPETVPGIIIDNLPDEEKVKVMNQCEYCYSFDTQTFYSTVAAMCGCISVIIPEPGKKRGDYLAEGDENLGFGIAFGTSPEEIEFARSSQKKLHDWIDSFDVRNHENVQKFLAYCQEYFQTRMDSNINW